MAKIRPMTFTAEPECPTCGGVVKLEMTVEWDHIETLGLEDGDRVRYLLKANASSKSELHTCPGEAEAVEAEAAPRASGKSPGLVQAYIDAHGTVEDRPLPGKILLVGPTTHAARHMYETNREWLQGWNVTHVNGKSVLARDRLRGQTFHVAVIERGTNCDQEMSWIIEQCVRLGDTPTIHYIDEGEKIDPAAWLRKGGRR